LDCQLQAVVCQKSMPRRRKAGCERRLAAAGRSRECYALSLDFDRAGVQDQPPLTAKGQGNRLIEIQMFRRGFLHARCSPHGDVLAIERNFEVGQARESQQISVRQAMEQGPQGTVREYPAVKRGLGELQLWTLAHRGQADCRHAMDESAAINPQDRHANR
jgi:hypothetical protein